MTPLEGPFPSSQMREQSRGQSDRSLPLFRLPRSPLASVEHASVEIDMPATDIARSADFYARVFGWNIRQRGDGSTSFDDTVGQVSGTWSVGRPPASQPGLLVYVMVDDAEATVKAIVANGGEIVQPIGGDAPEITARFRDPGGNVIGIYQQPGLKKKD